MGKYGQARGGQLDFDRVFPQEGLERKNRGAFYTPAPYAQKSLELLRVAIARVPVGYDYIILDRCAGTGNLEAGLTDGELAHCIVSTIEYEEYRVLWERLGAKVRHIIPPTDALSRGYLENPVIKQYLDDPKCTVILFENPPYAQATSMEHQRKNVGTKASAWKQSFVVTEMKKEVKGRASNDLSSAFIWSAFRYYLRQPTDSYLVYAPVKYWKVQHLIGKEFLGGFAFNRRHFHTRIDACIMVALWANIDSGLGALRLRGYDMEQEVLVEWETPLPVRRIHSGYSQEYYDRRKFPDDKQEGILLAHNGLEAPEGLKKRISPIKNDNILGYMVADGANFDNPDLHACLLSAGMFNGNGFFLRKDNYLEKLPMFCASRYITYNRAWTERGRIMKSADGARQYHADVANGTLRQFLLKCLLFTCLETQNHMRTFTGSDGCFYRNELCLDGTNGQTLALRELEALAVGEREAALLAQWETVLHWAKKAGGYDPALTYGVYQIGLELDTACPDSGTGRPVRDNGALHTALRGLKTLVRAYYNAEIVPTLFAYEYLK